MYGEHGGGLLEDGLAGGHAGDHHDDEGRRAGQAQVFPVLAGAEEGAEPTGVLL